MEYIDMLSRAAAEVECSKLTYIKECVRLFNSAPSRTTLTLMINTISVEHYTGDDSDTDVA